MKTKLQLIIMIVILLALGFGTTLYKVKVLGFSFSPDKEETVWTVESTIDFEADGGPVKVSLNMPDNSAGLAITEAHKETSGYTFSLAEKGNERRGIWVSKEDKNGPQRIYYRVNIYRRHNSPATTSGARPALPELSQPFTEAYLAAADSLLKESRKSAETAALISTNLINNLNDPEKNEAAALLLKMPRESGGRLSLAQDLLTKSKIPSRISKGLLLDKNNKKKKLTSYIEVFDGKKWLLINPKTAQVENPDAFLLWQRNHESLLEVEGGSNSKVRFSSITTKILANQAAIKSGHQESSWLIDFSIYSLPLSSQNTFRLLLLIPFGALIVVILRNLVGIQTAGTFMPILIALAFLQTKLIVGLILFITVVGVGLLMRSYLSHLNLLLVPRISAVLVFVITIYLAISVIGVKMGSELGLNVTFFPMIIISWSIERMCVLWEEEGGKDVLIQGSGSLFTASLIYLLMINDFVGNMIYAFPELLLVLLALILMIGTYSGYRLSELRRFEPMGRE